MQWSYLSKFLVVAEGRIMSGRQKLHAAFRATNNQRSFSCTPHISSQCHSILSNKYHNNSVVSRQACVHVYRKIRNLAARKIFIIWHNSFSFWQWEDGYLENLCSWYSGLVPTCCKARLRYCVVTYTWLSLYIMTIIESASSMFTTPQCVG